MDKAFPCKNSRIFNKKHITIGIGCVTFINQQLACLKLTSQLSQIYKYQIIIGSEMLPLFILSLERNSVFKQLLLINFVF